ncbi:putative Trypanosome variant surface glycoprotein (A type) [Trypanosoma vivax]|nr:putative Trypanosome variant surface glycoprotein (A type) [Trypanosoma vivax]
MARAGRGPGLCSGSPEAGIAPRTVQRMTAASQRRGNTATPVALRACRSARREGGSGRLRTQGGRCALRGRERQHAESARARAWDRRSARSTRLQRKSQEGSMRVLLLVALVVAGHALATTDVVVKTAKMEKVCQLSGKIKHAAGRVAASIAKAQEDAAEIRAMVGEAEEGKRRLELALATHSTGKGPVASEARDTLDAVNAAITQAMQTLAATEKELKVYTKVRAEAIAQAAHWAGEIDSMARTLVSCAFAGTKTSQNAFCIGDTENRAVTSWNTAKKWDAAVFAGCKKDITFEATNSDAEASSEESEALSLLEDSDLATLFDKSGGTMQLQANGATGCNLFATGTPGGTDVVFASNSNADERGSMTLGRLWTLKADYSSSEKGAKVTMDSNEKEKLKDLLTTAKQLAALALGQGAEEGESAIAKVKQLLQAQGGGTKGQRFATHRNSTRAVDHALSQLEKEATNGEAQQKRTNTSKGTAQEIQAGNAEGQATASTAPHAPQSQATCRDGTTWNEKTGVCEAAAQRSIVACLLTLAWPLAKHTTQ